MLGRLGAEEAEAMQHLVANAIRGGKVLFRPQLWVHVASRTRELEVEREVVDSGADVLELTVREPEISFQIASAIRCKARQAIWNEISGSRDLVPDRLPCLAPNGRGRS